MTDAASPNAREREYWNSAVTRPWSEMHDPIDRLFAELTNQAMEFAAPRPGEHVIDRMRQRHAVKHLLPPIAQPGPEDPGQFSWADPVRVRRILEGAGFRDVSLTPYDPSMRLAERGGAAEAADFAMKMGPVARALAAGSVQNPDAVRSRLKAFFASHDGPEGIALPGALWLVGARV